ncbi:MAG: GNAT family N-acetyltransferase, partial [Mesorhizobium sp.]
MNTLTIDIRKAEPRDAAAIADVHQEAWRGAYSGIIPHRTL